MEIIPTDQFIRDLKRIGKKYPSIVDDLRQLQIALLKNPTQGVFLGNDCYKIRLKIASKNKGKSGGARVVTFVELDTAIHLLTMYDKSELENVRDIFLNELVQNIRRII
jgi:mRNA-degrading endonuclease RelE of RelBE toxin-antitoxin system